ncbi:MAG TPA: T9SS type A sorting domain-containing protein [Bacteroidales bacterium]|nr:T9SS type A sorting domain-containing protein [Bacteroidales bacterium]
MSKNKLKFFALILFSTSISGLYGQQVIPAAGGNASGTGGETTYTLGQIAFSAYENTEYSVAEGVQQPFEISQITGIEQKGELNKLLFVYPNPTSDYLTLKVGKQAGKGLRYQLLDVRGKLLETNEIDNSETSIDVSHLATGTYFLNVSNSKNKVVFKIIKK